MQKYVTFRIERLIFFQNKLEIELATQTGRKFEKEWQRRAIYLIPIQWNTIANGIDLSGL